MIAGLIQGERQQRRLFGGIAGQAHHDPEIRGIEGQPARHAGEGIGHTDRHRLGLQPQQQRVEGGVGVTEPRVAGRIAHAAREYPLQRALRVQRQGRTERHLRGHDPVQDDGARVFGIAPQVVLRHARSV